MARSKSTNRERLVAIYERELRLHHDAQSTLQRACVSLATLQDARDADLIAGVSCAAHFFGQSVKQAERVAVLRIALEHLHVEFDADSGDVVAREAA